MALTSDDYIDIVDALIECVQLGEQQESARLIREKLAQLDGITFENNAKKQKVVTMIIARLNLLEKKINNKAGVVAPIFKETWELLALNVRRRKEQFSQLKKEHARLM